MKLTRLTEVMITAVLGIILISYLFIPVVASSVVTVTDNQNPSWVRMSYTEEDFSFSAVVSDGNMTIGTQTGEATEMMLFACDSGMLMYDDGFKLIYQSAGNTVVHESDATAIAVSCNNKTVTVLMGGVTYSMPMTWAYYPDAEGNYSYFPTDSYNFKQGDPVAVFGDFVGIIAYNDMLSQDIGLDFKATVQGNHLNDMHWAKLSEGESATDIGTVTGNSDKTDTADASNTESAPVSNVVTGSAYTSISVMNAGPSTVITNGGWQYVLDGNNAIITGYVDVNVDTLTIPATIGGYSVKQVGNGTAVSNVHTSNLVISNGIESIGDYAFQGADISDSITFPSSLKSIGNYAFAGCECEGSLNFGSTQLATIGDHAFRSCWKFTGTLYIPGSVTSIGEYAFGDCNFDKVIFNSYSPNVGLYAFNFDPYGEKDLTVTVVNNSILDLSDPNYGLRNAVFEVNGWQYKIVWEQSGGEYTSKYAIVIHHAPFTNVSITLPPSIRSGTVTYDVKQVGDGESAIATISNCKVTLPNSIERINANAFKDTGLTGALTIPSTVTEIGANAFNGCSNLSSLVVLSNPTISNSAFANTGIKEVLNLGTTEFTKTSYGLNADEVSTSIQADGCIAIIHDEQEKSDTVSMLMKILPIIILMVLLVLIAGPMFGMSFGRDGSDSSDSDEYDYY